MENSRYQADASVNKNILIMVVEDLHDQAQFLALILRASDYRVVCVPDGLGALNLMTTGMIPDVLVTDLKMPILSGFELMEEMRRRQINIPTIITSGSKSTGTFEEAYVLGAKDYLVKPFSPEQLLSSLQRVLTTQQR